MSVTHIVKVMFLKTGEFYQPSLDAERRPAFYIDKVRTDNIQSSLRGWMQIIPERILMTNFGTVLQKRRNHKYLKIVSLYEFEAKDDFSYQRLNEEKRVLQEFIDELKPELNKINKDEFSSDEMD